MTEESVTSRPEAGGAHSAARAGLLLVTGKLVGRGIDLLALLVLTRHLSPADFGLVALAMGVVWIVEAVLELPLVQALVRAQSTDPALLDTAFTLALIRGGAIALIHVLLAWPMAWYFDDPRLVPLIATLGFAPVLRGLVSPRMVDFVRRQDYRPEVAIDVTARCLAFAVSSTVAVTLQSHWALAAGTLTAPLVICLGSYLVAPYRPRPSLSGWSHFSDLVTWNAASQFLSAINWQFDRFLIARYFPLGTVGHYAVASDLSGLPIQAVLMPATRPLLTAYVAAPDLGAKQARYLKSSAVVLLGVGSIFVVASVLADRLVALVLGPGWAETGFILAGLCVGALFSLPTYPSRALAVAVFRSPAIAFLSLAEFVLRTPLALVGLIGWGIAGLIAARIAGSALMLVVGLLVVRSIAEIPIARQLRAILRPTAGLSAMAATMLLLDRITPSSVETIPRIAEICGLAVAGFCAGAVTIVGLWAIQGFPDGPERLGVNLARAATERLLGRRRAMSKDAKEPLP